MKTPGTFAASLQAFFTDRLMRQRRASPHTIASYRDAFRLLLAFAQQRLKKSPSALTLEDLDAPFIGAFLDHLEKERGNGRDDFPELFDAFLSIRRAVFSRFLEDSSRFLEDFSRFFHTS